MAYIIAHGTVNGYRKIAPVPPIGTEQSVLTDIRAEFDNTQTMLNKPFGFLIQMAEKGVWLSIVKLLFDGERSGNGEGFFAFSAFLPNNQVVEGHVLKHTLENLLTQYRTIIGNDFTKNIGVDWSFVEQATISLNYQCKLRTKIATTNYKDDCTDNKKGFAYVDIHSNAEIEQYLGKPFQPEYGEYRAVFLGKHLQNPNHLASQKQLVIDFDNEVYDIIWKGDSNNYPDVKLPKSIRKKDIPTATIDFQRQCHRVKTINISDGTRDDSNATITLKIPELEPVEYEVQFSINFPEEVISITATKNNQRYQQPRFSADKHSLIFKGEEALDSWHVTFNTKPDFDKYERDIIPFDDFNTPNGIGITLQKLKTVSLQILLNGKESTSSEKNKIRIDDKRRQRNISPSDLFNKKTQSLELKIPENKSLEDVYSFSLSDQYSTTYELHLQEVNEFAYQILLSNERIIKVKVPDKFANCNISYELHSKRENIKKLRNEKCDDGYTCYYINCNSSISRSEFSFFIDEKRLLSKNVSNDTIEIIGTENVLHKTLIWFRSYYPFIFVGLFGLLILLSVIGGIILIADYFEIELIDIVYNADDGKDDSILNVKNAPSNTLTYSQVYNELDSVYQVQKSQWNLSKCKEVCEKYDNISENLRKNDTVAYIKLKQLSWLSRTREKVENRDWNHLTSLVKDGDKDNNSNWEKYATSDIRNFLLKVIEPNNMSQQQVFAKKIKEDNEFATKDFQKVSTLWDKCKETQQSHNNIKPKDENGENKEQSSQGMASAGTF